MSPAIMTTTTTAPQMTTQLSATSSFDFNSPAIILIFILIITLLATLIVFSITVIVIYFLGLCRNSDRSAHYTSKSAQTRRLPQQEEKDTIYLTPLIRQAPDRVSGFDRPAFDRNQNLPQQQILDNPHIQLVSSTTPQRIRHIITNVSETFHNDFHVGYLCEPVSMLCRSFVEPVCGHIKCHEQNPPCRTIMHHGRQYNPPWATRTHRAQSQLTMLNPRPPWPSSTHPGQPAPTMAKLHTPWPTRAHHGQPARI
ncbi:unnamed protein product [Adineta ricciae]|nr:unnamed protein product [Adineta ricciae]